MTYDYRISLHVSLERRFAAGVYALAVTVGEGSVEAILRFFTLLMDLTKVFRGVRWQIFHHSLPGKQLAAHLSKAFHVESEKSQQ